MSRNYGTIFNSFADVKDYMGEKQDRPYPAGSPRETRMVELNDSRYAVRYHYTNVVIYSYEGLTLNTNGYSTSTTRKRVINDSLPGAYIYQKDFAWYVVGKNGTFAYSDLMFVSWSGEIFQSYEQYTAIQSVAECADMIRETLANLAEQSDSPANVAWFWTALAQSVNA